MSQNLSASVTGYGAARRVSHPLWVAGAFMLGLLLVNQGRMPGTVQLPLLLTGLIRAVPGVLLWWAAAWGMGNLLTRRLGGDAMPAAVRLALGAGAQLMLLWLIGVCIGFFPLAGYAVIGVGILALAAWLKRKQWDPHEPIVLPIMPWPTAFGALALGAMAAAAMIAPGVLWQPTEFGGYDALSYHLQLPSEWLADGRIRGYEHNVYSYLPNLAEVGFVHLGLLAGGMHAAALGAQLWHVTFAALTAALIGTGVRHLAGNACREHGAAGSAVTELEYVAPSRGELIAGSVYLMLPWTWITGTLAYTEQVTNAFAAAAVLMLIVARRDEHREAPCTLRPAWVGLSVGLLAGLAVMSKLTALALIAPPVLIGLVCAMRTGRERRGALLAGLIGLILIVAPLTLRNFLWTGNPLFPMFAHWLGTGHWTAAQAARWSAAHQPDLAMTERLARVWTHWLGHFQHGFVFWPAVIAALGWLLARGRALGTPRFWPCALAVWLLWQLAVWFGLTHVQSRFLVPMFVPGCIGLGLAVALSGRAHRRFAAVGAVLLMLALGGLSLTRWYQQPIETPLLTDGVAVMRQSGVWRAVNRLPAGARVYAEGFATPFYSQRPLAYHTVWDRSRLGERLNANAGDVTAALRDLRAAGFTHLLIDRAMIRRWRERGNYGYDRRITPEVLNGIDQLGLPRSPVELPNHLRLYRLAR